MKSIIALALASLMVAVSAHATTVTLSWQLPTSYTNGTPLPPTAISGTELHCVSYKPVGGTAGACSLPKVTVTGLATSANVDIGDTSKGGEWCYQAKTISGTALSALSAPPPACKSFAPLIPNPPTGLTVVAVVAGVDHSPAYTITASGARSSALAGLVKEGTDCSGEVKFSYRGLAFRQISPDDVKWWGTKRTENVAAPCG